MLPLQLGIPGGPLLVFLLFYLLVFLVALGMAYWVYIDGDRRGDDNAALWALAVGGLTVMTLVGGFVALAVYIWQRE